MSSSDEPELLKPGFASAEPEEVIQSPDIGSAHYDGMTDTEARVTWERETLCTRCLCAGVCAVAGASAAPLVAVTRCLSYLPTPG